MNSRTKIFSVILGVGMTASLCLGMTACKDDEEEDLTQAIVIEEDSYDMFDVAGIANKIMGAVTSGITSGLTSAASSVGIWAAEGILNSLGFNYYGDNTFKQEVLDRLDKIEGTLEEIDGKLDSVLESLSDSRYETQYNEFYTSYQNMIDKISTPYMLLMEAEANIEHDPNYSADNLNATVAIIANEVHGGTTGMLSSDLATQLLSFGHYFLGAETSVSSLGTYSLFNIAKRYVEAARAYQENRYELMEEFVAEPFSIYYTAFSLVMLDYTYRMGSVAENGSYIESYLLGDDGSVIAYTAAPEEGGEGTRYLNCLPGGESVFASLHAEELAGTDYAAVTTGQSLGAQHPQASMLAGYQQQAIAQCKQIAKLYTDFMAQYETEGEDTLTIKNNSGDASAVNKFSFDQHAKRQVRTVWGKDVLNVSSIGSSGDLSVKYGAFGDITKVNFETYAKSILPYAVGADGSDLTFRQFLEQEGFKFPTNNSSSYLLLGAKQGLGNKDDWYNNGYKWQNCVARVYVDLNMKVKDFVNSPAYGEEYYMLWAGKKSVSSSCGPKFEEVWYLAESSSSTKTPNYRNFMTQDASGWATSDKYNYNNPAKFYTIDGLSASDRTDTVGRNSLSF